jgi:hypothetical protein
MSTMIWYRREEQGYVEMRISVYRWRGLDFVLPESRTKETKNLCEPVQNTEMEEKTPSYRREKYSVPHGGQLNSFLL